MEWGLARLPASCVYPNSFSVRVVASTAGRLCQRQHGASMLIDHRSFVQPRVSTRSQQPSSVTRIQRRQRCVLSAMANMRETAVQFKDHKGQVDLAGIMSSVDRAANSDKDLKPKCVILCHGYSSHKNGFHMPAIAETLAIAGFNSLRFDFSGNGESEGTFRLSGYVAEAAEIAAAKQFLEQQEGQQVIGLLGHSKGGDDVIIYAATYGDIPLVINVAGRFYMADGLKQRFGDDIFERVEAGPVQLKATREDGQSLEWSLTKDDLQERATIDMAAYAAAIKHTKVLTIHGTADSVISVEDGKQFAARIPDSQLVIVQDADHNFRTDGTAQQMTHAVVDFIKANS